MDEGVIYEEGSPEQIFGDPQKERTRDFINKIRSIHCQVRSNRFDLYAICGQIENFCEKHVLPKATAQRVELLVEELLSLLVTDSAPVDINLLIAYSEKAKTIELRLDCAGPVGNPIDNAAAPDDLGRTLIAACTSSIEYQRDGERNRLLMRIK
jgi:polar amino acid transport system ATP-binding protein